MTANIPIRQRRANPVIAAVQRRALRSSVPFFGDVRLAALGAADDD